ncbi:MAG: Holliday junction resolvase RuvX [Planctomycetes bacterium]|nr:Holliday junction resolvase RuvX [Planctomycetota bacterium]
MSAPRAGVYVGLDYGRKRIGLAVSTPLRTVHPRPRLERSGEKPDLAFLCALAHETEAEAFVLGLPHNMDGTLSEMEQEVRAFALRLAAESGLPIYGSDERLTSEAAESALRQQELRGRERKARRDSAAACILLSEFLEGEGARERLA